MVSAPVFAGPQTSTVAVAVWPVSRMLEVLVYVTQLFAGTVTVRVSVKVFTVGSVPTQSVPSVVVVPRNVSWMVTHWLTLLGLPADPSSNVKPAVPLADPDGVPSFRLGSHVAVAVLVPLLGAGAEEYVQVYDSVTLPLFGTVTLVPPVTEHAPPLSTASDTLTPVKSKKSLGLVSVIVPLVFQPLSVCPVWVTVMVKVTLAVPPPSFSMRVGVADFAIFQLKVRVKPGVATFVTARSTGVQRVTVLES